MRIWSLLSVSVALVSALLQPFVAHAQPSFESVVQGYEAQDRAKPPPLGSVVVTGSSTIANWTTIQNDLWPLDVIARGISATTADDIDYYLDRIVLNYKPRAVVIYEGENDIVLGHTPT